MITGAGGLAVGSVAIADALRGARNIWVGRLFHWIVLAVCLSAVGLVMFDWSGLWFFVPIAAGSYAFALRAYLADRRRRVGWLEPYIRGVGGAYIALVTAVVVVSFGSAVAWILPTLIGVPLIELSVRRIHALGEVADADRLASGRS